MPTHSHGGLLSRAVASALAQSESRLDIFIVGDGVDEATRAAAVALVHADARVRFFDCPKGSSLGETHRHDALREARGRIVCYLSDDDLWLPGHVEAMATLLSRADFAHAVTTTIAPDESIEVRCGRLDHPSTRARMLGEWNFIPLSAAAHTLELYYRLPRGWQTTPAGTWTDLFMWRQILDVEGIVAVSGARPTVLHFPSPLRREMSLAERAAEMDRWIARFAEPDFEAEWTRRVLETTIRAAVNLDAENVTLREHLAFAVGELRRRP